MAAWDLSPWTHSPTVCPNCGTKWPRYKAGVTCQCGALLCQGSDGVFWWLYE